MGIDEFVSAPVGTNSFSNNESKRYVKLKQMCKHCQRHNQPCLNIIKNVRKNIRGLIELGEDPVLIMERIKAMIDRKVEMKNVISATKAVKT